MSAIFSIRPAISSDAVAIAQVHLASWQAQFVPLLSADLVAKKNLDEAQEIARWQKRLSQEPARLTYVAEYGGQVVGFCSGGSEKYGIAGYDGELYQIYVLPTTQGQGIGRGLVHHLAQGLQAAGFHSMIVWVMTLNPAVKFYQNTLRGVLLPIPERPIPEVNGALSEAAYGWQDLHTLIEGTHP